MSKEQNSNRFHATETQKVINGTHTTHILYTKHNSI